MKKLISLAIFIAGVSAFAATITMEGKITKINPADKEFYIKTSEGKVGEFYTTSKTEFFKSGNKITFNDLKKDDVVSVEADKKGKRLDPLKVTVK
jgi:CspA family cold shock protein